MGLAHAVDSIQSIQYSRFNTVDSIAPVYASGSAQEFIVLQRQTEQPLYQQLAGRVAEDIRAGVFAAGSKVPRVRKLAV